MNKQCIHQRGVGEGQQLCNHFCGCTTCHNCCLCDCKCNVQKKERKKVEEVSTWCRVFFSPLLPLKCDCPLLRRNWVFQEQPSLSKLALRATGHTRTPLGSFGPFLVCKSWGGASELRIHISGSAWWGG